MDLPTRLHGDLRELTMVSGSIFISGIAALNFISRLLTLRQCLTTSMRFFRA